MIERGITYCVTSSIHLAITASKARGEVGDTISTTHRAKLYVTAATVITAHGRIFKPVNRRILHAYVVLVHFVLCAEGKLKQNGKHQIHDSNLLIFIFIPKETQPEQASYSISIQNNECQHLIKHCINLTKIVKTNGQTNLKLCIYTEESKHSQRSVAIVDTLEVDIFTLHEEHAGCDKHAHRHDGHGAQAALAAHGQLVDQDAAHDRAAHCAGYRYTA